MAASIEPRSPFLDHKMVEWSARLPDQFDIVIHLDTTTALNPLERWSTEEADPSETYPTGV